ncbi:MAG: hypothetical protein SPL03_00255 [Succinivibrio dextrinosolvens]|nr:hypothetical protein [Succinivibrio dextrinosolvens]
MINTILFIIAVFLLIAFFVAPFAVDIYYRLYKDKEIEKRIDKMMKNL